MSGGEIRTSRLENNMKNLIARFVREEEGQDLIEYALLATLIALVAGVWRRIARHQPEHLVQQHGDQGFWLGGKGCVELVAIQAAGEPGLRMEDSQMKNLVTRFVREEEGQDLIEYALLATLIALVAGVGAALLGTNLATWYDNMATKVSGWAAKAV